MDYDALGLLDGLDGDARAQRIALLDWLRAEGFEEPQLREAHAEGLLPFLPAERIVMGGPPVHTARDLAEAAGSSLADLERLRRAQGLPIVDPDELAYPEGEAVLTRMLSADGIFATAPEARLTISRVLGQGLARAAETMRTLLVEAVAEPGLTELELAQRHKAAVEAVMPLADEMVVVLLRAHLRNMVRMEGAEAAARIAGEAPGAREIAVSFADLVGFTRLGEEIPPEELGAVADRLTVLAGDVISPPVTLVKTIGDAVMLVADDPAALVDAALGLLAAADAESEGGTRFPQVRAGVALGRATARGGDWFGPPVNLASRVTTVARAGSVLVTDAVRDAAREAAHWSYAGERRLKGIREPVRLFRARRDAKGSGRTGR